MLKNYFLIAFRNLLRNKSFVVVNILGLGIALACCITAYVITAYNIEFDDFHADEKVKNIYRLDSRLQTRQGDTFRIAKVPYAVGPTAAENVSGIERYVRYIQWNGYVRADDNAFGENITFADSTFFTMFDFPLLSGSHKAFNNKYSIFLSEEMATKYFGTRDAVGKNITVNFANDKEVQAIVGGVVKRFPANNTFVFNVLMRIENFVDINNLDPNNWDDWRQPTTFVEIMPTSDATKITRALSKFVHRQNEVRRDDVTVKEYHLEPFKSTLSGYDVQEGNVNMRYGFFPILLYGSMAAVILLIACFNLTNTSIALTSKRLKEVGIRKAMGAFRRQVISQFLWETVILISLAMIVGLGFAQLLVPEFTTMWGLPYHLKELNNLNLIITLLGLVFLASVIAGSYPALFQSRFKPIALLRGGVKIEGTNLLTRSLVTLQFALCVVVLTAGIMFIRNNKFQEAINFGYERDRILLVNVQNDKEYEALRNEIQRNPNVEEVGVTGHHVAFENYEFPVVIDTKKFQTRLMGVGKNYCEVMNFKFIQGRSFNMDSKSDLEEGVIVNRAFVEQAGLSDPLDRVIFVHEKKKHVIGVIDNHVDNPYRSKNPEPFLFYAAVPEALRVMLIKVRDKNDMAAVRKSVEKSWKSIYPGKPFSSELQRNLITAGMKQLNMNMKRIFLFLTFLAAILSAAGIYSLASLNIVKRTKEIGIRKVLGASVKSVLFLLNREFAIILAVAGIVGGVAGSYVTGRLLDGLFAYHIGIGVIPALLCALAVFMIGILTTSSTIYKAAKTNPVKSLRNE